MALFVDFKLDRIELTCCYDDGLDQTAWQAVKNGINDKNLELEFSHRPTAYALFIPLKTIYSGKANIEIISEGNITISASGQAKIEGNKKVVYQIESKNPSDMCFSGVSVNSSESGYGGMVIVNKIDDVDAFVRVSDKQL